MNDVKLGVLTEGNPPRDAIHVAVAPVIAGQDLMPGDRVGFVTDSFDTVCFEPPKEIGIVDPFLKKRVRKGERFWMLLFPGSVTSLRHEWTHPDFAATVAKPSAEESRRWIENFAGNFDMGYTELIQAAKVRSNFGTYTIEQDSFDDQKDEFWKHYENVTGENVEDHDTNVFTCSC